MFVRSEVIWVCINRKAYYFEEEFNRGIFEMPWLLRRRFMRICKELEDENEK